MTAGTIFDRSRISLQDWFAAAWYMTNQKHGVSAIFGTLFERSLDPARRSLIGAHYTSEEDILLLIEPVLMRPLEQRWAIVRQRILEALEIERAEEAARNSRQARLRTDLPSQKLLADWIDALTSVRVKAVRRGERHRWRSMRLDPALCASAVLSQLFRGMSLVPTSPAQIKCAKNIYVLGRNWPRATRVRLKHWSSWRFKHTPAILPKQFSLGALRKSFAEAVADIHELRNTVSLGGLKIKDAIFS